MAEQNEQRILTRLRKLADKWQRRHRTILLDYDDYYAIGLRAYHTVLKKFAGSDPLFIEKIASRRANWDMAQAARSSMKRAKPELIDDDSAIISNIDPQTMADEDRNLMREDIRTVLEKALKPDDANLAAAVLLDGLTLKQIAVISGLPRTTVAARWEYLRQKMKKNRTILQFLEDCRYGS